MRVIHNAPGQSWPLFGTRTSVESTTIHVAIILVMLQKTRLYTHMYVYNRII